MPFVTFKRTPDPSSPLQRKKIESIQTVNSWAKMSPNTFKLFSQYRPYYFGIYNFQLHGCRKYYLMEIKWKHAAFHGLVHHPPSIVMDILLLVSRLRSTLALPLIQAANKTTGHQQHWQLYEACTVVNTFHTQITTRCLQMKWKLLEVPYDWLLSILTKGFGVKVDCECRREKNTAVDAQHPHRPWTMSGHLFVERSRLRGGLSWMK